MKEEKWKMEDKGKKVEKSLINLVELDPRIEMCDTRPILAEDSQRFQIDDQLDRQIKLGIQLEPELREKIIYVLIRNVDLLHGRY